MIARPYEQYRETSMASESILHVKMRHKKFYCAFEIWVLHPLQMAYQLVTRSQPCSGSTSLFLAHY